ncbi:hypothetical protein L195_g054705, partial [Trifolium pratense]
STKLSDGNDIRFWKEKWIGTAPLCELFASLYSKTMQPDGVITTMGKWERDIWIWKPEWSALLSETESVFAQDLLLILDQNRSAARDIGPTTAKALKCLWLNNVPSKETIARGSGTLFGWQQRGVYGVNAITFYLEETSLMCLL